MQLIIFIIFLIFCDECFAATHWVSPTGTASWSSCSGETPLNGTSACSRSTANANAIAGDTVYFRGGTYTISTNYVTVLAPSNSGANSSNRIIYKSYPDDSPGPIMTQDPYSNTVWGIYLDGKSYIKIDGFTFKNIRYWGYIVGGSHHNEIANCTFFSDAGYEAGIGIKIDGSSCDTHDCWNTHNWIHHNTFSKRDHSEACSEGVDILRIGEAYSADSSPNSIQDNFNTIEDNYFGYAAHTVFDNYGQYNVVKRNISHNEPWRDGCTSWKDSYWTSASSVTVGVGDKTFSITSGLSLSAGQTIGAVYTSDYSSSMVGTVKSYSGTTLIINVTSSTGSGTYGSWIITRGQVPYYTSFTYNDFYGHRNFQVSDDFGRDKLYNLYESNRLGHASLNPNNDGAENFTIAAPGNIIRYNYLYNSMQSGIYFKYAKSNPYPLGVGISHSWGGAWNTVYNNTIYHSGYGWDSYNYGMANMSYSGRGIAQYNTNEYTDINGITGNHIINNLIYDSHYGDICKIGRGTPCDSRSWDYVSNNWLTSNGDPQFVNPDITDPTSSTLPDLTLQSTSPVKDGGTFLTQANGSGSNSTTLVVDNALYFQDGKWGSDLARGITLFPDWIAIGTVSNMVQISSINYSTNTITLESPMSWNDNAPIWLYKKSDDVQVLHGSAPDYGAHEWYAVYHQRQSSGSISGGSIPAP